MKFWKVGALMALLSMWMALPVRAQEQQNIIFFSAYDVPDTSYTYCVQTGQSGSPTGGAIAGNAAVSTSGSSTTVAATTASTSPFLNVVQGDVLYFQTAPGTAVLTRYVTARASADSITVDTAITLTARLFTFKHQTCAQTTTAGAAGVMTLGGSAGVQLCVATINATSITFSIEGRQPGQATFAPIVQPVYTATGCEIIKITEPLGDIRVGVKLAGDGGAQSVTATFLGGRW